MRAQQCVEFFLSPHPGLRFTLTNGVSVMCTITTLTCSTDLSLFRMKVQMESIQCHVELQVIIKGISGHNISKRFVTIFKRLVRGPSFR